MTANPAVSITVNGGGSTHGVEFVGRGLIDIGTSSHGLKQSERDEYPDLQVYTIARFALAIVTHPGVGITELSEIEAREISSGTIANWSEVGGPDAAIVVVSREEGSGTRSYFESIVMDGASITADIVEATNTELRGTVAATPNAIGYLPFGVLDSSVNTLAMEGVDATEANVMNGSYPIARCGAVGVRKS